MRPVKHLNMERVKVYPLEHPHIRAGTSQSSPMQYATTSRAETVVHVHLTEEPRWLSTIWTGVTQ